MPIDEIDRKMLRMLQDDGRSSARKISKELGVSTVTVLNRLKELKKKKIITRISVWLNAKKLGFELPAIISIDTVGKFTNELGKKLAAHNRTNGVYNITGDHDLIVFARFRDREDLSNFTRWLNALEGVKHSYTQIALVRYKTDYRTDLSEY